MRCGRSLVPLNFFETVNDADRHTGGRLDRYICQQCERKRPRRLCDSCGLVTLGGYMRGAMLYCARCAERGYPEMKRKADAAEVQDGN